MTKKIALLIAFGCLFSTAIAQDKFNFYQPKADAQKEIEQAIAQAQQENKHILLEIGGNWCSWCKLFYDLTTTDENLKTFLSENYVVVPVNYSKENWNTAVLEKLDFPQRFGMPVFVVLDKNGQRLHTQNSGYLEEGKGHSPKKVMEFLQHWSPNALNPAHYQKK